MTDAEDVRLAVVASVRMQSMSMRSIADFHLAHAKLLDDLAERIERGDLAPGMRAPEEAEQAPAEVEEVGAVVQHVQEHPFGNTPLLAAREGNITPAMRDFIECFDDRFRRDPAFVDALNAAADEGLLIEPETAEWVAGWIRARRDQAGGRRG